MSRSRQWRMNRPTRVELLGYGAILAAAVAYFAVLHMLDGRAETYFRDLRKSDPSLYLTQIRESRSFPAYLDEYRTMRGYDQFRTAAPDFLVGRWTMRPGPLRLTPGTAPLLCSDPVTFNYGILLMAGEDDVAFGVTYAIEGETVVLNAQQLGTITVDLVSYGARLDHIEFQPPGQDRTVYAYNCGR